MRMRSAIGTILGLAASVASADGISTSIQIGKWTIESSECLWAGQRHTSYPIWKMFDGRPDTAWVFSGVGYPKLSPKDEGNGVEKGVRLKLVPSHPVVIDELHLMNGYNKNEALYFKNSRVTEVSIFDRYPSLYTEKGWVPRKPLRKVHLSDAMGMKSIALPKRAYGELWIVVTGIEKGPGRRPLHFRTHAAGGRPGSDSAGTGNPVLGGQRLWLLQYGRGLLADGAQSGRLRS